MNVRNINIVSTSIAIIFAIATGLLFMFATVEKPVVEEARGVHTISIYK
jgi:hypothetical protein